MLDHNFTTTCPNVKMTMITLKPFSTAVNPDFSDEKKLNEKKNFFCYHSSLSIAQMSPKHFSSST